MPKTSYHLPCLYCKSPDAYKQYSKELNRYQVFCPVCQTSIPLQHYAQLAKEQQTKLDDFIPTNQ